MSWEKTAGRTARRPQGAAACSICCFINLACSIGLAQPRLTAVNDFPVSVTTEAIVGQPTKVSFEFNLYFPVDENRYIPVRETLANALAINPIASDERGMRIRVLASTCVPRQLEVPAGLGSATVEGASIFTTVELTPRKGSSEGPHQITMTYPIVDLAFEQLHARPLSSNKLLKNQRTG